MRIGVLIVTMMLAVLQTAHAQNWQTAFSVTSRVGYSSNTYLNPYLSEWNRTIEGGYSTVVTLGRTSWHGTDANASVTGGLVYEPFFSGQSSWRGGLAMADLSFRLSERLNVGLESGGSYFTTDFRRSLLWVQPTLSWFPGLFTRVDLKAGSNFRSYRNYIINGETVDSNNRIDLYAVEFETWPTFRWKFDGGLYGGLASLPDIGQGVSSRIRATRIFPGGIQLSIQGGYDRFQTEVVTSGTGGMGPIPETTDQVNRMLRGGIEGYIPVTGQIGLFAEITGLQYRATSGADPLNDLQISGGVRWNPRPINLDGKSGLAPSWEKNSEGYLVAVTYTGEGQLYLVGDFNNWERPGLPLVEISKDRYTARLDLDLGAYEYKILRVKGGEEDWLPLSEEVYTVDDGYGSTNAMIFIES